MLSRGCTLENSMNNYSDKIQDDVQTLEEQFLCYRINNQFFEKECPIYDDYYEGWLEKAKPKAIFVLPVSSLMEDCLTKQHCKELVEIVKFSTFKDGKTFIWSLGDKTVSGRCAQFFLECMKMSSSEYSKISNRVKNEKFRRFGLEIRDCINNLKNYTNLLITRDDIFRYRLKWLIAMVECHDNYKKNHILFDYCYEFDNFRINVDVYMHSNFNTKGKTFVMFSHSNMDDAFQSEEFYKLFTLLSMVYIYEGRGSLGLLCCKSYAYLFYFRSDSSLYIKKVYWDCEQDLLDISYLFSYFLNCNECENAFKKVKDVKSTSEIKTFTGIQKSNKKTNTIFRLPLQNITNLNKILHK